MTYQYLDIERNGIYLIYCSTQLFIDVSTGVLHQGIKKALHVGQREINKILSCDWSSESINICKTAHLNSSNLNTLLKIKSKIVVDV